MDRSMENGFHSPRTESFPVGLRVLVVDDDPTWLKILEKMLKRCSYEVTTCSLARVALDKLRERKDGFDIVISDVNMPDMDGFKLLEHVGLEMDLPVIMMSVDGETSRVMKGVQHGACDYLLKPVRMKELKNIWQHVLRKKIHEVKDIESYDGNEEMLFRHGLDNGGSFLIGGDVSSGKKRKETDNREHDDQEFSDLSSMKKARVVWSVDLHQKFVDAVNQIGLVKVGPKKILDLMNVPWLTRENVASHLQKYRLYLSRLQKPSDPKISFCGIKQQDLSPRDPNTNNSKQSQQSQCPIPVHQNSAATCGFGYTGTSSHVQDAGSEIHEGDLKGIISFLPVTEPKKSSKSDLPASQKKNGPQMSFTDSFGSSALDVSNVSFEANRSKQSWSREVPILQLKQQPKQEQEQFGYTNLPLPGQQHKVQAESLEPGPSINLGQSISGPSFEMKPFCSEYEFSTYNNISPVGDILGPIQAEAPEIINPQEFGALSTINGLPSIKHHDFNQHCSSIWESNQQNLIPDGSTLFLSPEELQPNFLQDYAFIEDVGLNNNEILNYHDPVLFSDVPAHSYDRLRFNNDYLFESTLEYPIIDQGLFIA